MIGKDVNGRRALGDRSGYQLNVGDKVLIPCTVVQVHYDEQNYPRATQVTIEFDHPRIANGPFSDRGRMHIDANQVDKIAANDEAALQPVDG